jgi:hypothetical protein
MRWLIKILDNYKNINMVFKRGDSMIKELIKLVEEQLELLDELKDRIEVIK